MDKKMRFEDVSPITSPKFNIAPENRPSQRKLIFQPSIFRGYDKLPGGISY